MLDADECLMHIGFHVSGIVGMVGTISPNAYNQLTSARALDVVHTVFICQGIWHYLVLNWGNLGELDHLTW